MIQMMKLITTMMKNSPKNRLVPTPLLKIVAIAPILKKKKKKEGLKFNGG
jgi:hypothetical protein